MQGSRCLSSLRGSSCARLASQQRRRGQLVVLGAHQRKSINQVCCSKTLVTKKGKAAQVQKLCQDIVSFSEEEATNKSKGIIVFQCVKDGWEDNVFHFWERYDNKTAMTEHNTGSRMLQFMEQVQPHLERPIGMALYEYQNGKIGTMCVAAGPKGEGGLDDATGAHGTAAGASMKQTSASLGVNHLVDEEEETGHGAAGADSTEAAFMASVSRKVAENFQAAFKSMLSFTSNKSGSGKK